MDIRIKQGTIMNLNSQITVLENENKLKLMESDENIYKIKDIINSENSKLDIINDNIDISNLKISKILKEKQEINIEYWNIKNNCTIELNKYNILKNDHNFEVEKSRKILTDINTKVYLCI